MTLNGFEWPRKVLLHFTTMAMKEDVPGGRYPWRKISREHHPPGTSFHFSQFWAKRYGQKLVENQNFCQFVFCSKLAEMKFLLCKWHMAIRTYFMIFLSIIEKLDFPVKICPEKEVWWIHSFGYEWKNLEKVLKKIKVLSRGLALNCFSVLFFIYYWKIWLPSQNSLRKGGFVKFFLWTYTGSTKKKLSRV